MRSHPSADHGDLSQEGADPRPQDDYHDGNGHGLNDGIFEQIFHGDFTFRAGLHVPRLRVLGWLPGTTGSFQRLNTAASTWGAVFHNENGLYRDRDRHFLTFPHP